MIAADLQPLARPCDGLTLMPGNPRQGNVGAVARSLERFGQRKPIVVTPDNVVIAGNHTLLAARQLGWSEIAVVVVDGDDAEAKAYALADNRVGDLGGYDEGAMVAMLTDVADADTELLAYLGWSDAELAALLSPADAVPVDTAAMLDAASYAVIVDCDNEVQQADLLEQFKRDGLHARPLMM